MMKSIYILLIIALITACHSSRKPDLSKIKTEIRIQRLEKDLFIEDYSTLPDTINYLRKKYPEFFDLYASRIIRIGNTASPLFADNMMLFVNDYTVYQAYKKTIEMYPDVKKLEEDFSLAFRYYQYYLPSKPVPAIYTFISGFNESVAVGDTFIAIGLDKYLGRDCEFYKRLSYHTYLVFNMHKGMIVSDAIRAWALTEFPMDESAGDLISHALYYGKIHYFQQCLMPDAPDSIIMGFSSAHINWCRKNEKKIWEYLIEQKLLFNTSISVIHNFTREGPYTKDFSKNSPARAVSWLGWMIIRSYMKKNQDVTLQDLMEDNDYRKILQKARYKP